MPWVRNKETGLVHDVPRGHWSLTDGEYEVMEGFKRGGGKKAAPKPQAETSGSSGSSSTRTTPANPSSKKPSGTSKGSASKPK